MQGPCSCVIAADRDEDVEYAVKWYHRCVHKDGNKVVVVCVCERHRPHASKWDSVMYGMKRDMTVDMTDVEERQIMSKLVRFTEPLRHFKIKGEVKHTIAEKPVEGILRVAGQVKADLIVVGSSGKTSLHRRFKSSISDLLIQQAHCPVVVYRRSLMANTQPLKEPPKSELSSQDSLGETATDLDKLIKK